MRFLKEDDSVEHRCDRCTVRIDIGLTVLKTEFNDFAKAHDETL